VPLLFDSHAVLWWLYGDSRVPARVRDAADAPGGAVCFSPVTGYELLHKQHLGKLKGVPPELEERLRGFGFRMLPLSFAHAWAAARLPLHHRDPWDRLLIAQAMAEGCAIVSANRVFARYRVPVLW
jgi:PIN domain nuclease of toxin-antitoxin system